VIKKIDVKELAQALIQWAKKNPRKVTILTACIILPIVAGALAPALLGAIGFSGTGPVAGECTMGAHIRFKLKFLRNYRRGHPSWHRQRGCRLPLRLSPERGDGRWRYCSRQRRHGGHHGLGMLGLGGLEVVVEQGAGCRSRGKRKDDTARLSTVSFKQDKICP
jgi:hypothetical protein